MAVAQVPAKNISYLNIAKKRTPSATPACCCSLVPVRPRNTQCVDGGTVIRFSAPTGG